MRAAEGARLRADLATRLATIEEHADSIAGRAPRVLAHHRDQLRQRLDDAGLPLPLDDERLLKEIALTADRCDISEETDRLRSHFTEFRRIMDSGQPAGRPLDFLCQEINRELNTIGSKANDAGLAHLVVAAKTELEKIREQAQNIE